MTTYTPTQVFAAAHMHQIGAFNFGEDVVAEPLRDFLVSLRYTVVVECPNGYLVAQYDEDELILAMFEPGGEYITQIRFDAPDEECPQSTMVAFQAVVNAWVKMEAQR